MIEFLSRFSRDVFLITYAGNVERSRELLRTEPDLAKAVRDGTTLLMCLPDDESRALEAVELLLAHGADPSLKNKEGMTPAEYATKRALYDVADLLRATVGPGLDTVGHAQPGQLDGGNYGPPAPGERGPEKLQGETWRGPTTERARES